MTISIYCPICHECIVLYVKYINAQWLDGSMLVKSSFSVDQKCDHDNTKLIREAYDKCPNNIM